MTKEIILDDKQALEYLRERVRSSGEHPERRPIEREWASNQAYFAGQQWHVNDRDGLRYPRNQHPDRYVANKIIVKVYRAVARLLATNAQFTVVPNEPDFLSRQGAKIAQDVYEHLKVVTKWRTKKLTALLQAAIFGSAFTKVHWDPFAGKMNRVYFKGPNDRTPNLEALADPDLRQDLEQAGAFQDTFAGEICLDIPTPYQVWWDPNCRTDVPDCGWLNQRTYPYLDDIKDEYRDVILEKYGQAGFDKLGATEDDMGAEFLERQIAFMAQRVDGGFQVSVESQALRGERCRLDEYWERPKPRNGMKGRKIVVAGELVLYNGPNPYAAAEMPIPFHKQDWFEFPGRFIGLSLVGQLRGPQRAYNEGRHHIRRFLKTNGHAPIFLQKGSGVKAKNLRAFPGNVYELNMTLRPPVFGEVPRLPSEVFADTQQAAAEMDEIAAQSDPATQLPGSLRSGNAVAQVEAANNQILTPTAEQFLQNVADIGTSALKLAGLFYRTPRVMQIKGADGQDEVRAFRGADLRGQHQLRVSGEGQALETAAGFRSRIAELLQFGAFDINDPKNRLLVAQAYEFQTADPVLQAILRQVSDEERILFKMLTDESYLSPNVEPWMDPIVRAEVLEREMNTAQFEEADQLTRDKVIARWSQHRAIIAERAAQQLQLSLIGNQQGQPGRPPGQASQPRPRQTPGTGSPQPT